MKKKLSFDGWLVVLIVILVVIIIAEGIAIKIISGKKSEEAVVDEESYIVLYEGREIAKGAGNQHPTDFGKDLDESSEVLYNVTYYNYENGVYKDESQGTFKYNPDGDNKVENVGKIAFSKKFNAIPRAFETLEEVPKSLKEELKEFDEIKVDTLDIDGDGTKEYFVCVKKLDTDDNKKPVAYSAIMLYSKDLTKISDLVIIEDGIKKEYKSKKTSELKDDQIVYLSLDMVEYIDLEDDNIMEVLIDVPQNEGKLLSIFNYSAYQLSGEKVTIENVD